MLCVCVHVCVCVYRYLRICVCLCATEAAEPGGGEGHAGHVLSKKMCWWSTKWAVLPPRKRHSKGVL